MAAVTKLWGRRLSDMRRRVAKVAGLGLLLATCVWARGRGDGKPVPKPPALQPQEVKIPHISRAPKIEDFEGMKPGGVAGEMLHLGNFIEEYPTDGAKPPQDTEVYLGYDNTNLYIVWLCFDPKHAMRANLDRRENIFDDDYVDVLLDTFHDKRHAFVFDANPYGVQADGLWTDGNGADYSWDGVWDSKGKVTDQGYIVWMSIPFKTIRFKALPEQTWGIVLDRQIPQNNEGDYWPRVSSRISSTLGQQATMQGFEGIQPPRNMQFNPYTNLTGFRALDTRDPINPTFDQKMLQGRMGLDSKFVVHDSLVFDTTINPDFSQVESDQPQIVLNQRFEVFFPEKRPFFLENANYFTTPFDGNFGISRLVFTRRIGDPTAGARLTGKMGPWDLGFFATDDRAPGVIVPPTSPLYQDRAYFGIGRVAYDFGQQSSIGALYTERDFNGDFNRVGGLDLKMRLNKNWTLFGRSVVSSTLDNTFGSGYLAGSDSEIVLNASGRRFNQVLMYQDISPGFRTEAGFVPRTDERHVLNYMHFYWRPEGKHFIQWGPEGTGEGIWAHDGTPLEYNVNGDVVFGFTRNIIFAPIVGIESDTLRPVDFPGLTFNKKFIQDFAGLVFRGAPWRQFNFNINVFRQGQIVFVVPNGQVPVEGDDTQANVSASVKPFGRLQIDNTWLFDRERHNNLDTSIFNSNIIRSKWNYQFTKELSFRFIGQYNGFLPNQNFTPLPPVKNMNYDFLVTYLIHPGTAVYVGYNTNLSNVIPGLCMRVAGTTECDPNGSGLIRQQNGYINDGRAFFIKVSYLWRP